jgi:hypothetical protein
MLGFDIASFRRIAFGSSTLPDHPLRDEGDVAKMIAALPPDAPGGLAELTHWAQSISADVSFTQEQRSRVLVALDDAVRPCWSELAAQYLAPGGTPAEGRDGNPAILRAMLESAAAISTGYQFSLETLAKPSRWVQANFGALALRRARWLGRRFTLAHMLHLPAVDDIWEDLHALYLMSDAREALRKVLPIHPGSPFVSSVKQEYTRILLTDMAGLEALGGRETDLAYRIAGRIAASARLEPDPIQGAICAIEVSGSSRPTALRRLMPSDKTVLYLDAYNCLPRLKVMLERNMDADLAGPDAMFGEGFTLRERNAMIHRLIDLWGPTPPQRRSKRVPLKSPALVKGGFDASVGVVRALEQGDWKGPDDAAPRIRILLDAADAGKQPAAVKKPLEATRVQLLDASVAGLGLIVPRKEAGWARLGILVAVYVEPGPDWVIGALRRISAEGDMLGLGIAIFTRQPRLAWFRLETTGYASVWEEEKRLDRNFLEHFQRGILVDADGAPLGPGEMLLAPGVASRGSRLDIPFAQGVQRIRVTAVREATEDYCRVAFESLGVTPMGA